MNSQACIETRHDPLGPRHAILVQCLGKLGLHLSGVRGLSVALADSAELLFGSQAVPKDACSGAALLCAREWDVSLLQDLVLPRWPGTPTLGRVTDYDLIVKRRRDA
eukprot:4863743-Amphidinium_carterae.1